VAFPSANRVLIDQGAAGHGWFVDPTPLQDEEYAPAPSGALFGPAGTAAGDHMDLLTGVLHEMAHFAGLPDVSAATAPADLMGNRLGTGSRLTAALDQVFARSQF
jgi:large repetitive protein